jgi:hypothetical protein
VIEETPIVDKSLQTAGYVFAFGTAVHVADHLRRGGSSISSLVNVLGTVGLVLQVVMITLIVVGHPRAAQFALLGFPLALGFALVHWVPGLGSLGDPIYDIPHNTGVTATASLLEIVGALMVAIVGLRITRQRLA